MKIVFYPTLYKGVSIPPPNRQYIGTLTAYYCHGVGGFDLRPFVLEIYEANTGIPHNEKTNDV